MYSCKNTWGVKNTEEIHELDLWFSGPECIQTAEIQRYQLSSSQTLGLVTSQKTVLITHKPLSQIAYILSCELFHQWVMFPSQIVLFEYFFMSLKRQNYPVFHNRKPKIAQSFSVFLSHARFLCAMKLFLFLPDRDIRKDRKREKSITSPSGTNLVSPYFRGGFAAWWRLDAETHQSFFVLRYSKTIPWQ